MWKSAVSALDAELSNERFCSNFENREQAIHDVIQVIVRNMSVSSPDKRQQSAVVMGLMWGSGKTALGREFCRLINEKPEQYIPQYLQQEMRRRIQCTIYCFSSYPDTNKFAWGEDTSILVEWEKKCESGAL